MPPLLRSAQLKPDVTITDADSDDEGNESDDDRYEQSVGHDVLNGFVMKKLCSFFGER